MNFNNIVFFNHFGNGDIFTAREFIKEIMRKAPQYKYYFAHAKDPYLLGDLGLIYTPTPSHGFALVVYNFMGKKKNISEVIQQKTTVGAGYNYLLTDRARLRIDVTSEEQAMAGVENFLNDFIISREI